MKQRARVIIWTVVGLMVLAVVLWRSWPAEEHIDDVNKSEWPEALSMTCLSCSRRYEMPSEDYLAGIEAMKQGAPSVGTCPACKSHNVDRTDHLGRIPRYAD